MINFLKLMRVQFKRTLKLYPLILVFTLALSIAVGALLGALVGAHENSANKQKFSVGMVGDTSDSYLGIGVFAIQNFDSSKDYINLINMSEAEAVKKLSQGEIAGYVLIPENLIQDLAYGRDAKLKYITLNQPAVLSTLFIEEVAIMVTNLVATSNNGAIGFYELSEDSLLSDGERGKMVDDMCLDFFDFVLNREELYQVNFLGYGNNLSFSVYYASALFIVMLLLWGTVFITLRTKSSLSFERMLQSQGRGVFTQLLAEFVPHMTAMSFTTMLLFSGIGVFAESTKQNVLGMAHLNSFSSWFGLGISLIPAIAVICLLQFLLFEFSSNVVSAISLQVISIVSLSLVSGFIFPIHSLPTVLQNIAQFLPTGIAFNYSSAAVTSNLGFSHMMSMLSCILILGFLLFAVRNVNMRRNGV